MSNFDQNQNQNNDLGNTAYPTEKKETLSHKIGDGIEKVGDFVSEKVNKKAGSAISDLGDKIEHAQD